MTDYNQKIKVFMKDQLLDLRNIKILESVLIEVDSRF